MLTIQEAFNAYKAGKTVIVESVERCRMTKEARKYFGKPIPNGVLFMSYVRAYQFWTNTHPIFKLGQVMDGDC